MSQSRSEKVVTYIEPLLMMALQQVLNMQENQPTNSTYIRKLIIEDVKAKGFLTDSMLGQINI